MSEEETSSSDPQRPEFTDPLGLERAKPDEVAERGYRLAESLGFVESTGLADLHQSIIEASDPAQRAALYVEYKKTCEQVAEAADAHDLGSGGRVGLGANIATGLLFRELGELERSIDHLFDALTQADHLYDHGDITEEVVKELEHVYAAAKIPNKGV